MLRTKREKIQRVISREIKEKRDDGLQRERERERECVCVCVVGGRSRLIKVKLKCNWINSSKF